MSAYRRKDKLPQDPSKPNMHLSPGERRVVELVLLGLKNREIAERIGITLTTVTSHLSHVYKKRGLKGRAQLMIQELSSR